VGGAACEKEIALMSSLHAADSFTPGIKGYFFFSQVLR